MSSIVLPSGSSCVLAKLMERRPLFSSFLFSKALAITLCFFSLTGLFEGFLNTLQQKRYDTEYNTLKKLHFMPLGIQFDLSLTFFFLKSETI